MSSVIFGRIPLLMKSSGVMFVLPTTPRFWPTNIPSEYPVVFSIRNPSLFDWPGSGPTTVSEVVGASVPRPTLPLPGNVLFCAAVGIAPSPMTSMTAAHAAATRFSLSFILVLRVKIVSDQRPLGAELNTSRSDDDRVVRLFWNSTRSPRILDSYRPKNALTRQASKTKLAQKTTRDQRSTVIFGVSDPATALCGA